VLRRAFIPSGIVQFGSFNSLDPATLGPNRSFGENGRIGCIETNPELGLEIGEFEGLPINNAIRLKAESWNARVYTLPERQCFPSLQIWD